MRRSGLTIAAIAVGLVPIVSDHAPAGMRDWPARPATMVVPYAAGGSSDVIARVLSPHLSEILRQQVIIENVGGAGGMIGAKRVAKAPADGYEFVFGNVGTHAHSQALYKHPPYNAATDFTPVALIAEQPPVLLVRRDLPVTNLQEFIAYTRANKTTMQYGSGGAGSPTHLACALLNEALGVDVTHVAYRGGGPAMQDLLAGRIDYQCPNALAAIPQFASKLVKPIAILTRERSTILPDLASAHEQGLKDFDVTTWNAFFLPKGTPAAVVRKLHAATVAAMDKPALQERLRELGAEVVAPERRSPEYLQDFVARELRQWAAIIGTSGVTIN